MLSIKGHASKGRIDNLFEQAEHGVFKTLQMVETWELSQNVKVRKLEQDILKRFRNVGRTWKYV